MPGKGRPFQKGHPGGPGLPKGYQTLTTKLKNLGYTLPDIQLTIAKLLLLPFDELGKRLEDDPDITVLEVLIINAILKSKSRGDLSQLELLLTRAFGKPKETVQLDTTLHVKQTMKLPDGTTLEF